MALRISEIVHQFRPDLTSYESLYKHLHSNPELSFQEHETSAKIQLDLQQHDLLRIQSNVGRTGVIAVLENGCGPTVLLRADIDALPVEEKTDLPYASKKRMNNLEGIEKPVMHVSIPTLFVNRKLTFPTRHADTTCTLQLSLPLPTSSSKLDITGVEH
jgi:hypothetical protein